MSSHYWILCLIIRSLCPVTAQRKEEGCFLFSQVHPFKNGIAHLFRTETIDTESKRNYHRETEYICMIAVFQSDILLNLVFFQCSTFIYGSDGSSECGAITPNKSPSSCSLIQMSVTLSGIMILPDSLIVIILLFISHSLYGEMSANLIFKSRNVVFKFRVGHFCINLRSSDICMSEYFADTFYWHTIIKG